MTDFMSVFRLYDLSMCHRYVRFGSNVGQIGTKRDKSGTFQDLS